jgi:hypothetical protein
MLRFQLLAKLWKALSLASATSTGCNLLSEFNDGAVPGCVRFSVRLLPYCLGRRFTMSMDLQVTMSIDLQASGSSVACQITS